MNHSPGDLFVKICGTTNEEDALLAVAMGADAVGFVFASSPRQVGVEQVREIVRRLPTEVMTVGVFCDEAVDTIAETAAAAGLSAVQLHGNETPAFTAEVSARVGFTIKAFRAGSDQVGAAREHRADAILLDADTPGSGKVFDWSLSEGIDRGAKLILAGGLTPANVGAAISAVRPWGVDVASGVESSPGRKDAQLVRSFIDEARRAAVLLAERSAQAAASGPSGGAHSAYDWEAS